jgi:hypothetical protein
VETIKNTAMMYGLKITGKFEVYEDCAIAKVRYKNIKLWAGSSNTPGEWLYIEVISVQERSFGGAKFWTLNVDDCTDYCWSFVMNNESDLKRMVKLYSMF